MRGGLFPAALAGLAALTAAPLAAATPAPAPAAKPAPVDPAAKTAAEALLTTIGFEKTMIEGMQASLAAMRTGEQMGRQLDANPQLRLERAKNPQAWDKALRHIGAMQADAAEAEVKAGMPEIRAMAAERYARAFSAADLQGFAQLYGTPLGRSLFDKLPEVIGGVMNAAQIVIAQRMAPRMRALQPAIQAEMAPLLPKGAKK
jgi:hypothetical protein